MHAPLATLDLSLERFEAWMQQALSPDSPGEEAPPREVASVLAIALMSDWAVLVERRGEASAFSGRGQLVLERSGLGDAVRLQVHERACLVDAVACLLPLDAPRGPGPLGPFAIDAALPSALLEADDATTADAAALLARAPREFLDALESLQSTARVGRMAPERLFAAGSVALLDCGDAGLWIAMSELDLASGSAGCLLSRVDAAGVMGALAGLLGDLVDPTFDDELPEPGA